MTNTVSDLHLLEFVGYILGGNKAVYIGSMPIHMFRDYVEFLDRLLAEGYIKNYAHYFMEENILDCRKALPLHLYKRGVWNYENEKYIGSLV
jgi:hypothetical protein